MNFWTFSLSKWQFGLLSSLVAIILISSTQAEDESKDGQISTPIEQLSHWINLHLEGKGPFIQPKEEFIHFQFGPALAEGILKGGLGHDPVFWGQDYEITELSYEQVGGIEEGIALVVVRFKNFDEPQLMVAYMTVADAGWRLINWSDPETGGSLIAQFEEQTVPTE